jgi:methylated-DNA-[protein]-cysteine S-methyltransferase
MPKTISYVQLAIKTGDPKATRQLRMRMEKNNIAIVVPCHRVIGASGELTGYAGGLWRKKVVGSTTKLRWRMG